MELPTQGNTPEAPKSKKDSFFDAVRPLGEAIKQENLYDSLIWGGVFDLGLGVGILDNKLNNLPDLFTFNNAQLGLVFVWSFVTYLGLRKCIMGSVNEPFHFPKRSK